MVEGPLSASTGAADSEVLRMRSLKLLLEEATCLEKSVVLSDGKALSEAGVVRPRLLGVAEGLGGLLRLEPLSGSRSRSPSRGRSP